MLNLGFLDVIIAMVVVLIVLSLAVQSLQQLVKKVLKLKSRVILGSLEDLLGSVVLAKAGPAGAGAAAPAAPPATSPANAQAAVAQIVGELKLLGRRSLFNRPMLDSVAKGDVVKVLTRLGATGIDFSSIQKALTGVSDALLAAQTEFLQGSASAKLAALLQALTPLLNDLKALGDGTGVQPATILNDLLNMRRIRLQDAFKLLGEVQDQVKQDLAAAQAAGTDKARIDGLTIVDKALREGAGGLKSLGDEIEKAVAPLTARLAGVELWYDTVMQGFEERYARHMKTTAVIIAAVTVIALNANFFVVYRRIAGDPTLQKNLAKAGETTLAERRKQQQPPQAQPTPATTPEQGTSMQDVTQSAQAAGQQLQAYERLGFSPLSLDDVERFWSNADNKSPGAWAAEGLNTLIGWLITVLLLSAGAPFWEDVLESLFGLKSLVRQKTGTKNVEEDTGGQPKP
ncbi:MAG TPA: hypothetical protein VIA62_15020 [Thermoanaerobaculia bacterium]|jgi:hypothetical protein|nr:hypothetical protein [Thermoanaerobaculia bacterium]